MDSWTRTLPIMPIWWMERTPAEDTSPEASEAGDPKDLRASGEGTQATHTGRWGESHLDPQQCRAMQQRTREPAGFLL